MIDYITYRRTNTSNIEVLILKVIAITMMVGMICLQFIAIPSI